MKIKKVYLLIVLFLCGLSVENVFASASAAAAAEEAAPAAGYLGEALRRAVREGNEAQVAALIAAQADVNARESIWSFLQWKSLKEWTPLMYAANNGHTDIAHLLLQAGAEIDAQDSQGMTALMYAARKGHEDIVKLLLSWGANKTIQNTHGYTAKALAQNDNIANIIESYSRTKSALKR